MAIKSEYTILAVDDARDTLMLLDFDLSAEGYKVITADSGDKALTLLTKEEVDLVLLDIYMPNLSGLATLQQIRGQEKFTHVPVIMLSASDDEDEIVRALDLGASDYVTKPYITKVLLARIRNAIRLKEKTQALELMAKTDHLTGLSNRKSFYEFAQRALKQSYRTPDYPIVVVMFDIDFFKAVNDEHGHDAGDIVLKEFAQLLNTNFREYDLVARIGGEEFAACLPNTQLDEAILACERFREQVKAFKFSLTPDKSKFIHITTSIGVVTNQGKIINLEDLMKLADNALYQAKSEGRNKTVNYNDEPELITTEEEGEKFPGVDVEIGMKNVLDDESLFHEILIMFYQDHGEDDKKLRQALSHKDILTAKHLAHTLKGVASSIGAMALFEKTKVLDEAINMNQEFDLLMRHFDLVSLELNIVLNGILKELGDRV